MGQVTLRDLSTNEDIVVPPEGFIFGRVGGDADIQIEDNSISRRQARVSQKGGMWLLETLAVPQGAKAPRPVQLQEGASFTVGQSEFEVVQIEEEEEEPAAPTIAPGRGKPGPAPASAAAKKPNPPPANAKTMPSPAQKRPVAAASAAAPAEEAPAGKGIGAMFVGVPKGIAYYLVNVPKLLVNPFGTVRTTIEEQPSEPMAKIELIGYALPSLFISAALPAFAAGLAALIGPGHVFMLGSFLPIGPAIGAVIGAVVTGFVFHPVVEWIINKLKGKSDARSRSNYFLQTMTLAIILAVPQALGILLAALPIPFINLLGPLLMVVGSLVSVYVTYQWMVHFDVVKWVLMVLKVVAVLSLLGAGWGFVSGLIATISGLGSGGSSAVAATGDTGDAVELGEMPTDPAEAVEWSKKRAAQLQAKAEADTKKAMAAAEDATAKAEGAAEDAKEDAPAEKPVKAEAAKPEPKPEPVAAKEPTPVVKDTPPAPVKDDAVAAPSGGYTMFAKRRDAIEKLFENDPTVLAKSSDLQKLYGDYIEEAYELDKRMFKDNSKKPERAKLNARLRDAELYQKTGKTIDSLAGKLGIR
ncbi:MAG: hypothetical protein Q8N23_02445 [Archangium sp.]|nr:hypothetical protein [Archangium sp.]MDP3151500.1 hypothetical protein [Archangium sp.]MDP3575392.1 hypothetical protein [Archangium sp.]